MKIRVAMAGLLVAFTAAQAWERPPREKRAPSRFDAAPLPPVSSASFPDLQTRHPDTAIYVALQYGVGTNDVLYAYLDAAKPGDVRDLLQLYKPGTGGLTKVDTIRGDAAIYPLRGGGGTIRGREFRFRNLESTFDGARVLTDLVLASGHRQTDMLYVEAQVRLEHPAGRSAYRIGSVLHAYASLHPEQMKPIALFGEPRFRLTAGSLESERITASLTIAGLQAVPGDGMSKEIRAFVSEDGTDRKPQQLRIPYAERRFLGLGSFENLGSEPFKWRPGKTYKLKAELNLGPVLGVQTNETTVTTPPKS